MKIISWNVGGFRAAVKKGFIDFFNKEKADIYCLQETKVTESEISFHPENYYCYLNPAEKKGYSGTIIYTKEKPINITYGIGIPIHDHEGRVITIELQQFYLVNVYVPNSQKQLARLSYRMEWERNFQSYLKGLETKKPVIVCGDFNVAHTKKDIANPKQNENNAGFTKEERKCFTTLLNSGFIDVYRYFYPHTKHQYTWWSYLSNARNKNIGWRIDYFIVSKSFIKNILDIKIHASVMGSDHCPIELILKEVKK